MDIRPIFASLRAHRVPAILIVAEIALACAVLCNAVFMIGQRVADLDLRNGIDEQGINVITLTGDDSVRLVDEIPRNLLVLRNISGVQAAAITNSVPLDNNSWNQLFATTPDVGIVDKRQVDTEYYFLGEGSDKAFGLRLVQGRFFNIDDYANGDLGPSLMPVGHVVIVTQSYAKRMWPGQAALGKVLYSPPLWYTVVGVVADVLCPDDGTRDQGANGFYYSVFFPLNPNEQMKSYVIRSDPRDRDRILHEAQQKLAAMNPQAEIKGQSFVAMRDQFFADTRSMIGMLALVCAVMLAVTAFGIVGLTSFWVQQRRRQIGIRRAVGATRQHILRYFQTENLLLSTVGVALGMAMAFGINLFLMRHYEMHRMPWYYLPNSAIALCLLGQLAVLGPALRAAAVPPVVATRSV